MSTKAKSFTTPKGVLKFPRLNKPETEVNGQPLTRPRYTATIILDLSEPGVKKFVQEIEALHEEFTSNADFKKAQKASKKKLTIADSPIRPHTAKNEDGDYEEVEGKVELVAKTAAELKDKDGTVQKRTVPLFDSKGTPLVKRPNVGGGTVGKLSITPAPYTMNGAYGTTLYLNGVQILELHEFGGGGSAASYGFGKEDGYEAPNDGEDGSFKDESGDDGDKPETDEDAKGGDDF
jgi:hypothetical protein